MKEACNENKKEESFGFFLKECRMKNAITLEQLSQGLCSASGLARIEAGTRTAGKALQDRLLCRLGISPDIYEHFLFEESYRQWKKRQQLLCAVTRRSAEEADRLLQEYRKEYEYGAKTNVDRRLEQQFCLSMEAQILRNKTDYSGARKDGAEQERLGDLFRKTLVLTVDLGLFRHTIMQNQQKENDQEAPRGIDVLLYSVQEMDLLLEWIHYDRPQDWKRCYEVILYLAEDSRFDAVSRAKVYPKAVYYLYSDTLEGAALGVDEELDAITLCENAVQCLREAGRMYYLWELLGLMEGFAGDVVAAQHKAGRAWQARELKDQIRKWQEWVAALRAVYGEFSVPLETRNSGWLYEEKEVYCLNETIRIRRKMLGLSRKQLGKNGSLCSEKTLKRLEEDGKKVQNEIIRGLMKGMGLSVELCRTELVTGEPEVSALMSKLRDCIRNRNTRETDRLIGQLREQVSLNIPSNRQALMRMQALNEMHKGSITEGQCIGCLKEALACTLPYEEAMKPGAKYLTNEEMNCIQNMVVWKKGMDEEKKEQIALLEGLYEACEKDGLIFCFINMYEIVMGTVASEWGNIGEYGRSDKISQNIIKECLYQRRTFGIHTEIYNIMWNDEQRQKKGIPSQTHRNPEMDLKHCIVFSKLGMEKHEEEFYAEKLRVWTEC